MNSNRGFVGIIIMKKLA